MQKKQNKKNSATTTRWENNSCCRLVKRDVVILLNFLLLLFSLFLSKEKMRKYMESYSFSAEQHKDQHEWIQISFMSPPDEATKIAFG